MTTRQRRVVHSAPSPVGDAMTDRPVLIVDGVDFWTDPTLDELIEQVGAEPVSDPAALKVHGVTSAEWDALYDALGLERLEPPQE